MTEENEPVVAPSHWHTLDLQDVLLHVRSDATYGLATTKPRDFLQRARFLEPMRVARRHSTFLFGAQLL